MATRWASPVSRYRDMLLRLKEKTDSRYIRVPVSHGVGDGSADVITSVISGYYDILAGGTYNLPFCGFDDEPCLIAKAMNFESFCRADGGEGNIICDSNLIR